MVLVPHDRQSSVLCAEETILCAEETIMKTYYGLLKSGEIRQYEKPPKRKHLVMDSEYAHDGTSTHRLICEKNERTFTGHTGFDRGPRLDMLIKKMLKGKS